MGRLKKVTRWFVDFIEIQLPAAVFLILFVAFLINIFFRYVVKYPLNWTFEVSVNAFVIVGLLAGCIAYRMEDHVAFDLLYVKLKPKGQNILRIFSGILIVVFFTIAIPFFIEYLWKIRGESTSILKIPFYIIFSSLPIMMISADIRAAYRLVMDFKALKNKTYVQLYNTEEKESLI
jgi:TRAP-type C4-dicarboxylate transport system permease small subunit